MVDDRYRIVARLGSGGMADVYCADDTQLGRRVALKILYGRFAEDDEFVERFRREASHAAGLQHQHVVSVYDRGEWDSTSYIAMEFVDGRTLKQIIQAEAPIEPLRAIDIVTQVLRAARFAHKRGIIHRDLKPHNVIVEESPAGPHAKVTDFGIARAGASDMTQTGSIMGTAQYLSPEQAQGHPVTPQSDLYSVGIVLYEMLTAKLPFEGESAVTIALKQVNEPPVPPGQLNPDVPGPLEDVILRALAKDPADRFADADEFIAALEAARVQIVDGTAPPATATTAFAAVPEEAAVYPAPLVDEDPVAREERRWPWALLVALLAAGVIVGLALLLGGGKKVKVANVVGVQSAIAAARLHDDGFAVSSETATSPKPRGQVIGQNPVGGTRLKEGATVSLTVSGGLGSKQVPLVEDLGRNAARKKLTDAGFEVGKDVLRTSDTVVKNHVISSSPPGGTPLDVGSTIVLVVSAGPERVDIPAVVNKPEDEASATLRDAGFEVDVIDKESADKDPGTVLLQAPAAGGQAPKGSTIHITVAREPETVLIPDVTGENSSDAVSALSGAGFRVKTRSKEVDGPEGDDVVLTQSPTGGGDKKAKRSSEVTITVGRFTPALDPEGTDTTTTTPPAETTPTTTTPPATTVPTP